MSIDPTSEVIICPTNELVTILLVKKAIDTRYFAFLINRLTGTLEFDGIEGSSIFPSKNAAFSTLQARYDFLFDRVIPLEALIGVAHFGPIFYILAVKSSWPVAHFYNRHTCRMINEIELYQIDLDFQRPLTPKELRRVKRIADFPLSGHHFWCETIDLTTPTFSSLTARSFVWNEFWSEPFEKLGHRNCCIDLLQGCCTSRILYFNEPIRFSLITIRESAHGGTRYAARGLNENGFAANEVQCELLVETNSGHVWSHVWRRGSVPIHWKSIISKSLPTVTVCIDDDYTRMTPVYFRTMNHLFPEQITCINLLNTTSEKKLSEKFLSAVSRLDSAMLIDLDWHHSVKEFGLSQTVDLLLGLCGTPYFSSSFTANPISPRVEKELIFANEKQCAETGLNWKRMQERVIRVNCMDSLDRTNVACFFYAAGAMSMVLEEIGIGSRATGYNDIMAMPEEIRIFLAEAFIQIGDCISFLYTNTPACMTDYFAEVAGIGNNRVSDKSIAVQRRYHNFLNDTNRQKAIDLFCGRWEKIIPDVDCSIGHIVSHQFMPPEFAPNQNSILISKPAGLMMSMNSMIILFSDFCQVTKIVMIVSPPNPPKSVSIYCSVSLGMKIPLVRRVAIPYVTHRTPISISIPPEYGNGELPIARFLYLDFESEGEFSLGNIFVIGNGSRHQYFSEVYQDIKKTISISSEIAEPNLTVDDILFSIKKFDYQAVLEIEISRVNEGLGRLDLVERMLKRNLNPLLIHLPKRRIAVPEVGLAPNEVCYECGKLGRWKCLSCRRTFCEDCSDLHTIQDTFYYESLSVICDECNNVLDKISSRVDGLLLLYKNVFAHICPAERKNLEWDGFVRPKVNNPFQFPLAFFYANDDPTRNLVLTDEGGEIIGPSTHAICFGCFSHIQEIAIEGSEDLSIQFRTENREKFDLSHTSPIIQTSIKCQFPSIVIKSGVLNKLVITGTPEYQFPTILNHPATKLKPKEFLVSKTKQTALNGSRTTLVEGKGKVSGLNFSDLRGCHALAVTSASEDHDFMRSYYIPEGVGKMTLRFDQPALNPKLLILYYDVDDRFTEPTIGFL